MVTGLSVEAASEGGQLMASWQDARLGQLEGAARCGTGVPIIRVL